MLFSLLLLLSVELSSIIGILHEHILVRLHWIRSPEHISIALFEFVYTNVIFNLVYLALISIEH